MAGLVLTTSKATASRSPLFVGSPSGFWPELAYRLRVAQPTFMDAPIVIILIYYYITIYVGVPHFNDLSALVGCWSSVYIRRIIYKFLNVCPLITMLLRLVGMMGALRPVLPHQLRGCCLLPLQLTVLSRQRNWCVIIKAFLYLILRFLTSSNWSYFKYGHNVLKCLRFFFIRFGKYINLYESLCVLLTIFLSCHVRLITLPLRWDGRLAPIKPV